MKEKIIKKIFVAAAISVFFISSGTVFAAVRARFPNENPLQPFPAATGAHPNFSGNVNNTIVPSFSPSSAASQASSAAPALPTNDEAGDSGIWEVLLIGIAVLSATLVLIRKYRKQ